MTSKQIQIIGAGSWGTALAIALSEKYKISLCAKDFESQNSINLKHISIKFPDIILPTNIVATDKISDEFDYSIIAIPSDNIETLAKENISIFKNMKHVILASKGMNHRVPELFSSFFDRLGIECLFLAGPNLAAEVAYGKVTSASIACKNLELANSVANDLSVSKLDFVGTNDYISAQLSGCYKNIFAIYSGYIIQKGYGENYRAKICVEALIELEEICKKFGSKSPSIISYFGLGDIVLSCFSSQSRNFHFGQTLATGQMLDKDIHVEGILASLSLYKLCKKNGFTPPILEKVYNLLKANTLLNYDVEN